MAEYYPPPAGVQYGYYQSPAPPPPPPGGVVATPTQSYMPQARPQPQPQPPPFGSYSAPFPVYGTYDEVRTLFVAGLPEDVKPREIYNLFREFPGYESSHLRSSTQNSQPFAFAVFSDQQSALGAMYALNGMVFDLEKGSTLYIDLAKSNSRSKRSRTDDEWTGSDKKARVPSAFSRGTPDLGIGSVHLPGMGNSAFNTIGYPHTQSHGNFDARGASRITAAKFNNSSAPSGPKIAPPCATLFVANLGPTCTEQELTQVFSRCPGFLKLKMQSTYGPPVAFVDFQISIRHNCKWRTNLKVKFNHWHDTASSTAALNNLQGTILYSSLTSDGMRLEYAKSRMGMPRKAK